ncbi:MAG: hypothetical protein QM736_05175 [Vicinamibacterales bacterium]
MRVSVCALSLCLLAAPAFSQDTPQEKPPITLLEVDLPLSEGAGEVTGSSDAETLMLKVYSGWRGLESDADGNAASRNATKPNAGSNVATSDADARVTLRERMSALNGGPIENEPADRVQAIACEVDEQPVLTAGPIDVSADKTFKFQLRRPLAGGDCVVVSAVGSDFKRSFIVTSTILDFGRLRGYFSIGGAVAQSRKNFSSTDAFIALTTDTRIVGKLLKGKRANAPMAEGIPLELSDFRIQLNSIVDARVGVKFQTSDTSQSGAATGGTPVEAPFQRPDQLTYSWDQPGYLQLGMHMPMSFKGMDWRSDGKLYTFFVGPIVKGGVQAFDSPVVVKRTVEIDLTKESTDTARYKTTIDDTRDGALPFVVYGVRLGIYGYDLLGQVRRNRQISNDPVSYVDIALGKTAGYRSVHL